MSNVKSITTVQVYGGNNNGNWVARLRLQDGTELFAGLGAGYSLAQAQAVAWANPDNAEMLHPITRQPMPATYQPLPDGVTIRA